MTKIDSTVARRSGESQERGIEDEEVLAWQECRLDHWLQGPSDLARHWSWRLDDIVHVQDS